MADDRRLVWTSDSQRVRYCPRCDAPQHPGACASPPRPASGTRAGRDGIVRISRSSRGRGGKTVTLVSGLPDDANALATLAQRLKKLIGSGGTVREDGVIELQGDQRDIVEKHLVAQGFRVKRAGG